MLVLWRYFYFLLTIIQWQTLTSPPLQCFTILNCCWFTRFLITIMFSIIKVSKVKCILSISTLTVGFTYADSLMTQNTDHLRLYCLTYRSLLASLSDSRSVSTSPSLTGPFTFLMIERLLSSMNSTRTWWETGAPKT